MNYARVGSLTALLAGAGLALAQAPDALPNPRVTVTRDREVTPDQAAPRPAPGGPVDGPMGGPMGGPPLVPPNCGGPECGCRDPFSTWIEADYLLWWVKENRFPPLLTAGTPASGGVLGLPGTVPLVADTDLDNSYRSGGRITIGGWVTEYRGFGLELNFFMLETRDRSFSVSGTGAPGSAVLARPFFNVLTGSEDALAITAPSTLSGTALATNRGETSNDNRFFGTGFNFTLNFCCEPNYRVDGLLGYRYLSLDDHFAFVEDSLFSAAIPNIGGTAAAIADRIDTSNRFNGGVLGLRGEWRCGAFSARGTATVAFGSTDEGANVNGVTTSFAPGRGPIIFPGGFLATAGNFGKFTTEQFAIVPEAGLTLGYQVCGWLKLTAGYNFLYWSNVARSGDQVNRNVNLFQVPSVAGGNAVAATPPNAVLLRSTDYWAQGITLGFELRY
jgi:hypothetical protein